MSRRFLSLVAALAAAILILAAGAPAAATPPTPLTLSTTITYQLNSLDSGAGSWGSALLGGGWAVESSDNAGYYRPDWPGWRVRTFHNETILSDATGAITIQSQMRTTYFDPLHLEAVGQWTIVDGEGAYADLHGSGSFTTSGRVDLGSFTLTAETHYVGRVHWDPAP